MLASGLHPRHAVFDSCGTMDEYQIWWDDPSNLLTGNDWAVVREELVAKIRQRVGEGRSFGHCKSWRYIQGRSHFDEISVFWTLRYGDPALFHEQGPLPEGIEVVVYDPHDVPEDY